jgi:hypothetical protein
MKDIRNRILLKENNLKRKPSVVKKISKYAAELTLGGILFLGGYTGFNVTFNQPEYIKNSKTFKERVYSHLELFGKEKSLNYIKENIFNFPISVPINEGEIIEDPNKSPLEWKGMKEYINRAEKANSKNQIKEKLVKDFITEYNNQKLNPEILKGSTIILGKDFGKRIATSEMRFTGDCILLDHSGLIKESALPEIIKGGMQDYYKNKIGSNERKQINSDLIRMIDDAQKESKTLKKYFNQYVIEKDSADLREWTKYINSIPYNLLGGKESEGHTDFSILLAHLSNNIVTRRQNPIYKSKGQEIPDKYIPKVLFDEKNKLSEKDVNFVECTWKNYPEMLLIDVTHLFNKTYNTIKGIFTKEDYSKFYGENFVDNIKSRKRE